MDDIILHKFDEIAAELDALGQALNDATALQDDVAKIFNALNDVYTGEAATALHAAHHQISQQLDQLILDMRTSQHRAEEQQVQTQQLDHQLSRTF